MKKKLPGIRRTGAQEARNAGTGWKKKKNFKCNHPELSGYRGTRRFQNHFKIFGFESEFRHHPQWDVGSGRAGIYFTAPYFRRQDSFWPGLPVLCRQSDEGKRSGSHWDEGVHDWAYGAYGTGIAADGENACSKYQLHCHDYFSFLS